MSQVSEEKKMEIIKLLRQNMRQIDVAKKMKLKPSTINYFYRYMKHIDEDDRMKSYFNVDAYYKTVATI